MHLLSKMSLAGGITAALSIAVLSSAAADPPSGVTPAHTDIVGVGSDTTSGLMDQLSADYNAQSPAPTSKMYSWDAVGSSPIVTKTGCSAISRPDGANAGISAISVNAHPAGDTTDFCIDFVGSARGPNPGTTFAFAAFAQDAVTWSATTTTAKPTHAPAALSILELRAIYSCNASIIPHSPAFPATPVTWNEVGGSGTNAVVPVIPQAGSDTRTFFLTAIGATSGSCVSTSSVDANEGTNSIFAGTNSADLVFPYSVGVYLAQTEHGHGAGTQGNQSLRSVLNTATPPVAVAPTTGTAPNATINPLLATVGLTRALYNIVRNTGTSTHVPTYMQGLFGASSNTGYVCANATAQAEITNYGFWLLGSNCGNVTLGL